MGRDAASLRRGLGALLLLVSSACSAAAGERGHLLVDSYGALLLIRPDGVQKPLANGVNRARLSPDGSLVAFTDSEQSLTVFRVASGARYPLVRLSAGAHFDEIGWTPDGNAVAYTSEGPGGGNRLFLASFPPAPGAVRLLGPWYQGFSFSPDGSRVVHAVNFPASGLEVLDLSTGSRELLHEAADTVWEARFSPDGRFIAYRVSVEEPAASGEEPDCTPPTLGLRVYTLRDGRDTPISIRSAPEGWKDVKSFDWSRDSREIALTLGPTDCDYPGGEAGIFLTSLDLRSQSRLSSGRLAFEPRFSPDGTAIAYVDFSDSPARLLLYDLGSRTTRLIRRATQQDNVYRLSGWR